MRALHRLLALVSPRFQSWLSVKEARVRTVLIRRGWIEPRQINMRCEGFRVGSHLGGERVPFVSCLTRIRLQLRRLRYLGNADGGSG